MNYDLPTHMTRLRQYAERLRADHVAHLAKEQKRLLVQKLDYESVISNWWRNQPPATRHHPWSIEVIAAAAFKDQPRPPALRCIAAVLRNMGFIEKRDWTIAGRNRRQWLPPKETS